MPAIISQAATHGRTPTPHAPFRFTPATGGTGRLVTTITLLLAAALLAGCSARITIGGSHTVDSAKMADAVRRQLQEKNPDLRVGSTVCPKGVKLAEGVTFQCTADLAGARLPVTVTLSHVNTDQEEYDYDLKWPDTITLTDEGIKLIESRLQDQAPNAKVECATPPVRVVQVGGSLECTVSESGKRQVVRAVIDDVDTVHFEPPLTRTAATGKIGDKLTVHDQAGDAQLEVTVTRLKFWPGDEFDRPQHGLYMGAYVTAHALADEQDIVDLYALVGGHHYNGDAITGSTAFDPLLEPVTLNRGERTAGWLVFDVPARHGQLVLRDLDEHTVGVWKY